MAVGFVAWAAARARAAAARNTPSVTANSRLSQNGECDIATTPTIVLTVRQYPPPPDVSQACATTIVGHTKELASPRWVSSAHTVFADDAAVTPHHVALALTMRRPRPACVPWPGRRNTGKLLAAE